MIVNRSISGLLTVGLTAALLVHSIAVRSTFAASPLPDPPVALLDMHPVDPMYPPNGQPVTMPKVVRQGEPAAPDSRLVQVPVVVTPSLPEDDGLGNAIGKAGTGFFIGDDGTLLTAAHVTSGCGRMQIISKYVPRSWVSLVAADKTGDIAILKAPNLHPPAVLHLASNPPAAGKFMVLGYPATAGLTVAAESWGVMENDKFPANIGSLANPREMIWMSAPGVTHGYSGGPIFDPRLGAVVGIVKGEVEGGYLRLIRDMPTTGIAIGPGVTRIDALVRREVPYSAVNLISSPGEAGQDTLRRATVHVLCWH
jgi:S1-C subfamily serine protease